MKIISVASLFTLLFFGVQAQALELPVASYVCTPPHDNSGLRVVHFQLWLQGGNEQKLTVDFRNEIERAESWICFYGSPREKSIGYEFVDNRQGGHCDLYRTPNKRNRAQRVTIGKGAATSASRLRLHIEGGSAVGEFECSKLPR